MSRNKIVSLKEAVSVIQDGDIVLFGGLVDARRPVAAMYEIIRQKKKNLLALNFLAVEDMMVSAGCIAGVRGCYTHMGIFGKAPGVHRALAKGELVIDDIGHIDTMMLSAAPAFGLPFVASPYCIGTDIVNPELDRSEELRAIVRNKEKIPRKKYIFMDNPFSENGEKVALFSGIRPDVSIIHVGQVGTEGTCRIDGNQGVDQYAAFSADKVIITAEEIVPEEYLRQDPNRNLIPCTQVDMIVHAPWGAHPTLNPGYYDLDMEFLKRYQKSARSEEGFKQWADEWVYGVNSNEDYLDKIGAKKMERLKAIKPYGFRPRMDIASFVNL